MDENSSDIKPDNKTKKPMPTSAKKGAQKSLSSPSANKVKISLEVREDCGLFDIVNKMKALGVKNIDWSDVVCDALETIDDTYWAKLEGELTPIEVKFKNALENPELREKLEKVLSSQNLH